MTTFPEHVKFFIVGGYVRDRLLGRESNDHDFVVVGATPEMMLENGFQQVGADFPVFLHPESGDEYALARKERKVAAGYHGFETDFNPSVTLEDDLYRRDLTINAMAREVVDWNELGHAKLSDNVIDPFGGQQDLTDGVIRHVSEAFAEDPVRVLRAARFAARYNFDIADETVELMRKLVNDGELDHLTAERVWQEFEKTMKDGVDTFEFLNVLDFVEALEVVMPELNEVPLKQLVRVRDADEQGLSVAIKCAMITSDIDADSAQTMWRRMKAPSDAIKLAHSVSTVCSMLNNNWRGDAQQILDTLKTIDAFRNGDKLVNVLKAVSTAHPEFEDTALLLSTAHWITRDIGFDSLGENLRETLKSREIGEAIDGLREQIINRFLNIREFLRNTN